MFNTFNEIRNIFIYTTIVFLFKMDIKLLHFLLHCMNIARWILQKSIYFFIFNISEFSVRFYTKFHLFSLFGTLIIFAFYTNSVLECIFIYETYPWFTMFMRPAWNLNCIYTLNGIKITIACSKLNGTHTHIIIAYNCVSISE